MRRKLLILKNKIFGLFTTFSDANRSSNVVI
nr:MAG TPA: hypothetical protein [Caudoviricetes sp.]